MDFEQLIVDFKENDSEVSSPLWIWFIKEEASYPTYLQFQ